jgi:hypothetical protein
LEQTALNGKGFTTINLSLKLNNQKNKSNQQNRGSDNEKDIEPFI